MSVAIAPGMRFSTIHCIGSRSTTPIVRSAPVGTHLAFSPEAIVCRPVARSPARRSSHSGRQILAWRGMAVRVGRR